VRATGGRGARAAAHHVAAVYRGALRIGARDDAVDLALTLGLVGRRGGDELRASVVVAGDPDAREFAISLGVDRAVAGLRDQVGGEARLGATRAHLIEERRRELHGDRAALRGRAAGGQLLPAAHRVARGLGRGG